ncbi:glycosyl hydrolase 108 family protein [Methylobacter sp. G7]|uniref:glycoside hydrolase family 108 protein n=1 Tax=Methylobacter sp. G7 TaxID=3230117 RepID=UPI003D806532
MNFEKAIKRILSHEGGFTQNPTDRGNWTSGRIGVGKLKGTKYGISAMTYPDEDIKNLSWERACFLYQRDFWAPLKADRLHDGVAYQLLDFAVNSGTSNAVKAYQRALGVAADGVFGPQSLHASNLIIESDQILLVLAERLDFMASIKSWIDFGRGWARRIAANLRYGALDS